MCSALWRQNNAAPEPRVLDLGDHPRLADLDGWLHHSDAQRAKQPPPAPRDREFRHVDLGNAAGGVVNPPSARIRRCGEGAQFVGDRRTDGRHQLDPVHEDLGSYVVFDPEPELQIAPIADVDLGGDDELHGIGVLAQALHRKTHTIRDWERRKIIPPPATRTAGKAHTGGLATTTTTSAKRMYTGAMIDAAAEIAHDEGLLMGTSGKRPELVNISETAFTERVTAAWNRLRAENS